MATGYGKLVITESQADAWILSLRGCLTRESTQALRDEIDELLGHRLKRPVVVNLAAGARSDAAEPVEASHEEFVQAAVAAGSDLCVVCAPEEPSLTTALLCCRNLSLKCTSLLLTR
jgi:hypothetical protein